MAQELKSKAKLIKDIPWDTKIEIAKIIFDPNLVQIHKDRIDKIFAKATMQEKEMQLQNIMVRDTIFNHAMSIVASCFEFQLDQEEVNRLIEPIKKSVRKLNNMTDEMYEQKVRDIATKLVQKQLMFEKIAELEKITVSDEEAKKVLDDYYAATNMPVGEILRDQAKFENAKRTLLEEKITVHIIEKFPRDMSKLHENMKKDMELAKQRQEQKAQDEQKANKQ